MKVLALGASGKTGRLVVAGAIAKGHDVRIMVRYPARSLAGGARQMEGDALNPENVLRAVLNQDAVIQCIGGTAPWMSQTLEQKAMQNIVSAMKTAGIHRLLVVSMMGINDSVKQCPGWYRFGMMTTFLRGAKADKTAMEKIVAESGLDWIIARPPILTDEEATSQVHVLGKNETGHVITRSDLATWLIDQLESDSYLKQAVVVVNR